jgi:photosystem II stability/assembly factor-like uncharacterized protein
MNRILTFIILSLPGFLTAQWVQVPSPTANSLNNLYFINDTVGYAGDENSTIVTYDGGRSWSMNPGFIDLLKASYLDSLNGFGITENNLYKTSDGGATWVDISDSLRIKYFRILECVNGKTFVSGNRSRFGLDSAYWYVSDDGGASWEIRYMSDTMTYGIAQFIDDQNITGVALSNFMNPSTMVHFFKSEDGGYTWNTYGFYKGVTDNYTMYCADLDTCFIGSFYGGLAGSGMGIHRLVFSSLSTSFVHSKQDTTFSFLQGWDQSLFVGGMQYLMVSPDRGVTWYDQDISFLTGWQRVLFRCHVFNDSSAVITGENGSIIFTENFGLGLSEKFLHQPGFSVFPNPSSKGYQDIALTGITPHTMCNIDLFDLRGNLVKQVFSGRIESSDQHIRVDLNDLAAGSYFYRVQTDEGVSQKKVVVVH